MVGARKFPAASTFICMARRDEAGDDSKTSLTLNLSQSLSRDEETPELLRRGYWACDSGRDRVRRSFGLHNMCGQDAVLSAAGFHKDEVFDPRLRADEWRAACRRSGQKPVSVDIPQTCASSGSIDDQALRCAVSFQKMNKGFRLTAPDR